MQLKSCYEKMGADYEDTFSRLQSERLICRVAQKFKEDQSFTLLKEALDKKEVEQAFLACHTLKGICLNLGFKQLTEGGVLELTELLRSKNLEGSSEIMEKIDPIYQKTMEILKELEE